MTKVYLVWKTSYDETEEKFLGVCSTEDKADEFCKIWESRNALVYTQEFCVDEDCEYPGLYKEENMLKKEV